MAEWREWNPSNEPDTCLWCGRKLKHEPILEWPIGQAKPIHKGMEEKGGAYKDGFFCGLRCGYLFGEQMAKFGHRIKPDEEKQAEQ